MGKTLGLGKEHGRQLRADLLSCLDDGKERTNKEIGAFLEISRQSAYYHCKYLARRGKLCLQFKMIPCLTTGSGKRFAYKEVFWRLNDGKDLDV